MSAPPAQPGAGPPRRPIRPLPPAVAARIAAGEVIERPASVVKELVENALDAGARHVQIEVRGGGLGLIRVADDGHGIPAAEVALACQRHATSKLVGDDLRAVDTLGFRGEALPSIAAVADLTLVSAVAGAGLGHRLALRDGRVLRDEPAARPVGTTVTVTNLFHRLPARLAAAEQPASEARQIGQTVRRLAVAAPGTSLTLTIEERVVIRTSGAGDLPTALAEVYGAALPASLLPLGPVEVGAARLWGLVSGPELTRPGRSHLHVVVNGRWARPSLLLAQAETAYRPLLPRGRHPVLVVRIEAPPDRVDINIHPAKLEVRLVDERALAAALAGLLREALGRQPAPIVLRAGLGLEETLDQASGVAETTPGWEDHGPIVTPNLPPLRLIGQVQERLLLLEGPAGLYLIDQHRAHERILYERLRAEHTRAPVATALPDPIVLELRPAQVARFQRRLPTLATLGFECEVFGGRTFLVRGAPVLPGVLHDAPGDTLAGLGLADEVGPTLLALTDDEPGEGEEWLERLLVSISCRTAVRRGRPLSWPAMRALVERLGHGAAPAVCPHGSPLLMHVSSAAMARQFDWR